MSAWKTVHLEIHPYLSVSVSEDYELMQNTIQLDWFILWWCQPNLINTMPDWLIIVLGTAKYHCRTGCNKSNNWAIYFQNVICSAAFLNIRVIFLYETGPIQWICSEHYGYWWSGVFSNINIKKNDFLSTKCIQNVGYEMSANLIMPQWVKQVTLEWNGWHFACSTLKSFSLKKNVVFCLQMLRVQYTTSKHWIRYSFGTEQLTDNPLPEPITNLRWHIYSSRIPDRQISVN